MWCAVSVWLRFGVCVATHSSVGEHEAFEAVGFFFHQPPEPPPLTSNSVSLYGFAKTFSTVCRSRHIRFVDRLKIRAKVAFWVCNFGESVGHQPWSYPSACPDTGGSPEDATSPLLAREMRPFKRSSSGKKKKKKKKKRRKFANFHLGLPRKTYTWKIFSFNVHFSGILN